MRSQRALLISAHTFSAQISGVIKKLWRRKYSGITYLGRPIEEHSRRDLLNLIVSMDWHIGNLSARLK